MSVRKRYKIKEFAEASGITVRTLQYYDDIGILKPIKEINNNYRIYVEDDFLKLQQILTMKYIGLSLEQIKKVLNNPDFNILKSLKIQEEAIHKKMDVLSHVLAALNVTINSFENSIDIDWKQISKIIAGIKLDEGTPSYNKYYTSEQFEIFSKSE